MQDRSKEKKSIDTIRESIDEVDSQILELLNQRADAAREIGKIKEKLKARFHAPEREKEIFERLKIENKGLKERFPTPAINRVFREIISASLSLEKPMRVAYLGPKGTFTHLACRDYFGLSVQTMSMRSIPEVFEEVEHERVDYGVVPIENSTEGIVSHTLDLFVDSKIKIIAEDLLEIEHNLMMRSEQPLSSIQTVASHPHALAQCRNWLAKNLPGVTLKEMESTAHAAQFSLEDEHTAAIGSRFAAETHGLQIVYKRIQDQVDNFTRFLILGLKPSKPSQADKTSILFSVKDQPGALFKMLKPFSAANINMTKIESRPRKNKLWEYVFFIDIDGHSENPKIAKAIKELEKMCVFLKVLGSYPKAILPKIQPSKEKSKE